MTATIKFTPFSTFFFGEHFTTSGFKIAPIFVQAKVLDELLFIGPIAESLIAQRSLANYHQLINFLFEIFNR